MNTIHDVLIIGAGLSGLSAAHFLQKLQPQTNVLILEKSDRPGGAIRSFLAEGFHAEWGPHGFLNNTEESLELLKDTGLINKVQKAPLGDFVRFVCNRGRLVELPQSPPKLLTTPLLSPFDKLRLLADLWIKPDPADQTIGAWAGKRFGKGVLHLVDAAVSGTFAGDLNRLSINSVMPGVRDLEIEYGSVLKGLKNKKKLAGSKPKDLPAMLSFPQGIEQFTHILAEKKSIQFNTTVTTIERKDDTWLVTANGKTFLAGNLIVALPVNASLRLLERLSSPPVSKVPMAKIVNVVMGFAASAQVPRGFGYLAPERENRFTMGAMFSSHMFPGRAPVGNILIEALVGGRRHPERLELNDVEMVEKVYEDISKLMALPDKPWFTKVLRPESGIPQLEMDHPALQEWLAVLEKKNPGLYACGFGWEGIGMNDMTKSAKKVAKGIIAGSRTASGREKVKPVYF